ncbi:hypothetical protein PR003_g28879 [Phytophthora rubi]|uniref:Uncharacterized protein n=1 Tax=Phytophthora rubi TaxID=129364 RepID=A0A6A4BQX7_9STRA|nr:hypothetical protein PR003_g28879 [Phytophthora rubi]
MAAQEVGLTLLVCLLYLGGRVVAVGTDVLQRALSWFVSPCAPCANKCVSIDAGINLSPFGTLTKWSDPT